MDQITLEVKQEQDKLVSDFLLAKENEKKARDAIEKFMVLHNLKRIQISDDEWITRYERQVQSGIFHRKRSSSTEPAE